MVYQGSKNRIAKELIPIIQKHIDENGSDTYIELFVGGANVIDKVSCKNRIGYDINKSVITLLKYAQNDPDLSIAPEDCPFEHYADVRANQTTGKYPQEYVALIGYSASYGGRYYDGGYGRDPKGVRNIYKERITNFKTQTPYLKDIEFNVMDYKDLDISKYNNCVFYLDPPYRNTKNYSRQLINYEEFYDFCRELSKNNIVLISEYNMPDDFECIWEKSKKVMQKSDRKTGEIATERLYKYKGV